MKLKEMAQRADMVEKLKLENKLMKLELQKMKDTNSSEMEASFTRGRITMDMTQGSSNSYSAVKKSYGSDPFLEFQESDPPTYTKGV